MSSSSHLKPSLFRLKNKCAVLTGACQGIGFSIAEVFAHEGSRVVIVDRDEERAQGAAFRLRERGYSAQAYAVDLLDNTAAERVLESIVADCGGIDILVNNARNGIKSDLHTQDLEGWDQELGLMLKSTFQLSQLAIRSMKERGGGAILNISSVAHFLTVPESPAYHAAKGGVEALTRYLAASAGRYGVRVNSLSPGHVYKSEQSQSVPKWKVALDKLIPIGHVPTSTEIGYAALLVCSDDATLITGQSLVVDGGLSLVEQAYTTRRAGLDF